MGPRRWQTECAKRTIYIYMIRELYMYRDLTIPKTMADERGYGEAIVNTCEIGKAKVNKLRRNVCV